MTWLKDLGQCSTKDKTEGRSKAYLSLNPRAATNKPWDLNFSEPQFPRL